MEEKAFMGQYLIWVMLLLGQLHGYQSCIQKERKALLELKTYLASQLDESIDEFTWPNDTRSDCCRWEGVKCNLTNGRVIELTLLESMFPLRWALLNLSLLHPFEELRSLNLSGGWSYMQFAGLFDDIEGYKSLGKLRNLEILDLSRNSFNNSIFPFLNAATSLTTLFLRSNVMSDPFSVKELKDLTNLELLDLSSNRFNGSLPIRELSAMRKLKALDLSDNQFSGSMDLQGICKLKNMQELDLSNNKLVGQFHLCLTNLTELRVLDLSSNQLTGMLPSSLGNLESLEYLSLTDNNFEGFFSLGWLANLSELKVLKLDSLQVELESSWKAKHLSVIVLRSCHLEKVPKFLLHQKDWRQVDLSGSKISGSYPSWLLENNTKLEVLLLQNNSFTSFQLPESAHNLLFLDASINAFVQVFPENIGWIFPHLRYMNLADNGFQGNLPSSLGNMKMLEFLDISHNSFCGKLPRSFVEGYYSMRVLKLSHNKLSGEIFLESSNFTGIVVLFMDNNQFTGKIGQGLRSLTSLGMLDISNNNLSGVIPSWIGEFSSLYAFLLSNNSLEGEIPISLFNISSLLLLDLSANMLTGDIPPRVNSVYGGEELMLLLQDNNLSGVIQDTLLENVKVLDVRNNRLSGEIPEFINTESISMLLLRGNNLIGRIPRQLCTLRNIHLLDLANNRLNGSIPSCLGNSSFGLGDVGSVEDGYYDSYIFSTISFDAYFKSFIVQERFTHKYDAGTQTKNEFATKHRYDAYMGGNLALLFGMDLSENELSGEIPAELGSLVKLRAFNLSHNNVESLDFSFNRLQGQIPPQLTELSSLAVFKVSYNNLSGIIPQGRQFNTFDQQSYLGNPLLCGKPTNRSCNSITLQEPDNEDDGSTIDMVSFYWSFAAAYVTILIGIFASLSFDSPWRRYWFYIVDIFIHKARKWLWCQIH